MSCVLVLVTACEVRISGAPGDGLAVDAAAEPSDALGGPDSLGGPDALGPWSKPAKVAVASSAASEDDVALSADTRELFFAKDTGANGKDLYYASRDSATAPWTTPLALAFNSATQSDETPRLSADEKTLYFASGRAGNGTLDIYAATRAAPRSTAWSPPVRLTVSTTTRSEKWYTPCGDRYVMVQDQAATGSDLVEGTVGGGAPTLLTPLNSTQNETGVSLTPDCLTVYFASIRSGSRVIYTARRASLTAAFTAPAPVIDFAIPGGDANQGDPWLAPDGRTFAFESDAAGSRDLYLSTR
jgi:Tol biopolymer transport system component